MPTTFIYTEEDLLNPEGNNNLSARAKFFQRSLYKDFIYPEDIVKPLDTWYDKNLFGRIDQEQNVIIPQTSQLEQIEYGMEPNMFCLNFLNRAFTRFVDHMKTAYITHCLDPRGNSALYDMRAMISYVDPTVKWTAHKKMLINVFVTKYVQQLSAPLKNFSDFKKVFMEYLVSMSGAMPITKTNFLLSSMASPFGCGLKIGIAQESAGDDEIKYDAFIRDPNFSFYVRAAKKFGFIVDKNAPWILTADLFSDAIQYYINFYLTPTGDPITQDNFFTTFYRPTYPQDMQDLQSFVREAYSAFWNLKPFYEVEKVVFRPQCPDPLQLETSMRTPLGDSEGLDDKETIDLYSLLRYTEAEKSGPDLKMVRRRSYEIYRATSDKFEAMSNIATFINASYKDFVYPQHYDSLNPRFDLDSLGITGIIDTSGEVVEVFPRPSDLADAT